MAARAFKRIRSFLLNKFKPGSRKRKERDTSEEKIPQLDPLPEWRSTLLSIETQRSSKSDKPLPELPSVPLIPATRGSVRFDESLPTVPSRRLSRPVVQPLGPQSTGSSTITTARSSTITTTTATTVDSGSKVVSISSPTSPNPNTNTDSKDDLPVKQIIRSGAPGTQSKSGRTTSPASWSELVDDDLVANLGPRERARQEALFEIVFGEERYASELARMKEIFVDPLLRTFSLTPAAASPRPSASRPGASQRNFKVLGNTIYDSEWEKWAGIEPDSIASCSLPSPVAGRFTTPVPQPIEDSDIGDEISDDPPLINNGSVSVSFPGATLPCRLPKDLRICLEVIENDLLEGHVRLSKALKNRYEAQLPLVRSLEDVFVSNSHILAGYTKYIHHLERAVGQVGGAIGYANGEEPGPTGEQGCGQPSEVGAYIRRLEENAAEKGEAGLVVSLWKPLQRLFNYHRMFHDLLSQAYLDLSEHDAALEMMIAEVERAVGGVGGDEIRKQKCDMTRDILGRIDGLHMEKQLALPKPSRILIEERMATEVPSGPAKLKSGSGREEDLWFVVFTDVVLKCQRTGTTSLPKWGAYYSKTTPTQGTTTTANRGDRRKPRGGSRNLYKFLTVETWDVDSFRESVASSDGSDEDLSDSDGDSSDSDRKTKTTSSTWGFGLATPHTRVTLGQQSANLKFGTRPLSSKPIRDPPRFRTRLVPEPTVAPPPGEDRENKSPEPPSTQGIHQQEQPQVEEVAEDTWRLSIQTDDIPMPGSYFCKHYVT